MKSITGKRNPDRCSSALKRIPGHIHFTAIPHTLIIFPHCKINLGLNILEKRSDGYHELQSVMYPLAFTDILESIPQNAHNDNPYEVELSVTGMNIPVSAENNLCTRAFHLLKKDFPELPDVRMHLHKMIPFGAGLGGGSADGAFALRLLNQQFRLGLTTEQLLTYAIQLGSDCPFFILGQPCRVSGRGEQLEPIPFDLSPYQIVLVYPGISVSTAWAFSKVTPCKPGLLIPDIIKTSPENWKNKLVNDFEEIVFQEHPDIKSIKEKLYDTGALYASLTGSGSTVYGLYKKDMTLLLRFPENYLVKILPGQF